MCDVNEVFAFFGGGWEWGWEVRGMGIINFHYLDEVFGRYGRIWLKRKIVKLVC